MNANDAVIRDRGYSGYDGTRRIGSAWRVIAEATVRVLLDSKGGRRSLGLGFVVALVAGVVIWVEHRVAGGNVGAEYPLRLLTKPYGVVLPALFVALAIAGGTLAEDRRAGALPFYFARPLTPRDYLVGRWLGAFVSLAAVVAVPTTMLALYRALIMSEVHDVAAALGVAVVVSLLGLALAAILASYALLAGGVAASRGAAQGLVGAALVLPWIIAGVGANVMNGPWASLLSLPHLLTSVGAPLIRLIGGKQSSIAEVLQIEVEGEGGTIHDSGRDPHTLALPIALIALLLVGVGSFLLLRARVERLGRAGGQTNDS